MKSWTVILPVLAFTCARPAIRGVETSYRAQVQAREAEVAARVGGRIKRVDVHDNEVVVQGAPLIELDDRELRARVTAAQADLAARQGDLQQADAAVTSTPANRVDLVQAPLSSRAPVPNKRKWRSRSRGSISRTRRSPPRSPG